MFTLLLNITSITASWAIKKETVAYLSIIIEEHHYTFKKLYPDKSIIPKMHYMLHYAKQIQSFGPLIYSWTMRHESKLNVIKRAASHGNYKSICYSVVKRYLQSLCYDLNCNRPLLSVTFESSSNLTELSIINEPKELHDYMVKFNEDFEVYQPKWIKFGHLLLKKTAYLYLDKETIILTLGKLLICIYSSVLMENNMLFVFKIMTHSILILILMVMLLSPCLLLVILR